VLTVSPSAVYCGRSLLPMFPTTAGPVLMPMPHLTGGRPCSTSFPCRAGAWAIRSGPVQQSAHAQDQDRRAGKKPRQREAPGEAPVAHTLADHAPVC
jgi:hypothetical protein